MSEELHITPDPEPEKPAQEPSVALAHTPKERRGRPSHQTSAFWEMITVEYITGTMTISQMARKYGVLYASLRYHLQEKLEVKAREGDAQAMVFMEAINVKNGALSEKAREAAGMIVRMASDVSTAWQKEQVERCYQLRKEIDDGLQSREEPLKPLEMHKVAQTEELVDRTARRSLGLKDGLQLEGSMTHHHRHVIEAVKEVLNQRDPSAPAPSLDADFELLEGNG